MSHEMIAAMLWSLLVVSIVLALIGLIVRIWWLMMIAAIMTLMFAIAAMFSIGIFILPFAILEAFGAIAMRRNELKRYESSNEP